MGNRIDYIDVMKGLAILLVVIGHYFLWMPWLPTIIWSFHMPLFVFLNGLFFKNTSLLSTTKRSFIRYMIPYILVWLCLIIIKSMEESGGGKIC